MYAEKKKSNQLEQVQSKKSSGIYAEKKGNGQFKPVKNKKTRGMYIEDYNLSRKKKVISYNK